MYRNVGKRLISGVMALILAFGYVPMPASAIQTEGLCVHHTEHTSDCGGESFCTFQCDECEQTNITGERTFSRVELSEDLPDNDELFEYFLMRELYDYDNSTYGIYNRSNLSPVEQEIYDLLKAKIEKVALQGGSTEFVLSDINGLKDTWTNTELGLSSIEDENIGTAANLFFAQFDVKRIMDALLGDCPFDLYWFDKTPTGGMYNGYSASRSALTNGSQIIYNKVKFSLMIGFSVVADYQGSDFCVTSDVSKVQTAKNNAANVVSINQGKTAYQKLVAYKDYICQAVDYNFDALDDATPYGNPWQLIYVFDGDPSTKVVCEGYSKAFQYLCDLSRLDCISVTGLMSGEDHMWNVVTLNEKNYLADVTNSDTSAAGRNGELFLVGGTYQNGGYTYQAGGQSLFYQCEDLELAETNYTPGHDCRPTKYSKAEPSCTEAGRKEHWKCAECGKLYDDADCSHEVTLSELTIPATGHTEVTVSGKAATCTESGLTDGKKCSVCGEIIQAQTVIEALGHKEETITGKAATCTESGLTDGKKCSVCGRVTVDQKTITAPGHTEEIDPAKAATCMEEGLTEGSHCSVCKETLVSQKPVPKKAHGYTYAIAVRPTKTETGALTGTCDVCGDTTTVTLPVLNTTDYDYAVEQDSTCSKTGLGVYHWKNTDYGDFNFDSTISKKSHTIVDDAAVEATCTKTGLTAGSHCSVCSEVLVKQETVSLKAHTEITITGKAATCTESGLTDGKQCKVCGEITVNQTTIPAKGHTEETITGKAASCTEAGLTEGKKCSTCGETLVPQKTISPAHTYKIIPGRAATCTESGLTDGKVCSNCGAILKEQSTTNPLGHSEENVPAKAATCTEAGWDEGVRCVRCLEILRGMNRIEPLGHTEVELPGKKATCTESGLTDGKKCSVCDEVIQAQTVIEALGHTEVKLPGKAATCTESGLTDGKKCSTCSKVTVKQTIIPAAHKEATIPGKAATCTGTGLTDGKKCSACGKILVTQKTIKAKGHSGVKIDLKKATLDKDGYKAHYECRSCKKWFKDSSCKTEAKKSDYVISAVKTAKLSTTRYTYDGKKKTPSVSVYNSKDKKLTKDKDYTVSYASGRKSVGEYKVTVKGKGNYSFTKTLTLKIVPPKTKISSLKGKTKSFTVTWSKKTSQVSGYQIQYSRDKSFESGAETVTVKDNSTVSKTIKSLKSKKYYYVRVRTYKTVSGEKFYSSWSDALRVKTK